MQGLRNISYILVARVAYNTLSRVSTALVDVKQASIA